MSADNLNAERNTDMRALTFTDLLNPLNVTNRCAHWPLKTFKPIDTYSYIIPADRTCLSPQEFLSLNESNNISSLLRYNRRNKRVHYSNKRYVINSGWVSPSVIFLFCRLEISHVFIISWQTALSVCRYTFNLRVRYHHSLCTDFICIY